MVYSLEELGRRIRPVAERYRLRAVYVFGSYARGDADESSDVDLLIDTDGADLSGFFALGGLYCALEEALGKKIDLVTIRTLEEPLRLESDKYFRENVRRERKEIYAVA